MSLFKTCKQKWLSVGLLVVLLALLTLWLELTPHSLDGKLGAIGYAVCHQIESHTLAIGGKLLPLCARCTGMYLGFLAAFSLLSKKNKPAGRPALAKMVVLGFLFLLFVVDGVNSMLATFFGVSPLYTPTNTLRLALGLVMGVILANILLPMWNQTLWKESDPQPVLSSWKQFALVLLIEAAVFALVRLDIPLLYYPVAILSLGSILVILGMVYTLLWTILLNKENTLGKLSDGSLFLLLGVVCAIAQIGLMDLLRFHLTGSWSGFQV